MAARFVQQYGLPEYDATTLIADCAVAAYFRGRQTMARPSRQQTAMGEISRRPRRSA